MEKSERCLKCKQPFKMPVLQCFASCSNCNQLIIYLCHIQKSNQKDLLRIKCDDCNSLYSILTCPSCYGSLAFKNFYLGKQYSCPCGFKSNFIVCNKCVSVLALPAGKNYEKTDILCKNRECKNIFRYKNCQLCQAMIYQQQGDRTDIYICPNSNCDNSKLLFFSNKDPGPSWSSLKDAIIKVQQGEKQLQEVSEKDMCKICLDKQAQMINTKCYHLSVCFECSKSMKNQCPICRTQGQYKRVFKS